MPEKEYTWKKDLPDWDPKRVKMVRALMGGMTQKEFAKKIGLSTVSVSDIERGRIGPNAKLIAAVARMDLDINWFLNGISKDGSFTSGKGMGLLKGTSSLTNEQKTFIETMIQTYLQTIEKN